MGKRVGLDIGANSIGWIVYDLDDAGRPTAISDIGVRIFDDGRNPKDKTSKAHARRIARGARRRRDRYLKRRERLMAALVRHGLMPADLDERKALEDLDPYELRARGLDGALTPYEFGRAIFHLNQRRGFQSNRKADAEDDESGKVKEGGARLRDLMAEAGARTVGEFFAMRHADRGWVRARLVGEGAKAEYVFYPQRAMIAEEFDALWAAQTAHHPELLDEDARADIRDTLLFQRPLRPVRPGKCLFFPEEERAPWALPRAQRYRIYQEVNNLRLGRAGETQRALTIEERDKIARALLRTQKRTFDQLRKLLGLDSDFRFNLESERRKHLDGDKTATVLRAKKRFGKAWDDLDLDSQTVIVERLLAETDEEALVAWLIEEWNLDETAARRVSGASLPDGHATVGRTALTRIEAALERAVIPMSDAVVAAGLPHHSDFRTGEVMDSLPYYGRELDRLVAFGSGVPEDDEQDRFGRIANPTVHIGLNQLRRVVNALIARHGHPDQIVVELARQFGVGAKGRSEIERNQTENQKKNDARRARLADLGYPDNGENRMRLRLWEELDLKDEMARACVYTGEVISIHRLFGDEVDIDHILPFSMTLDNSVANRIVCLSRANRQKRNQTPFEAWGDGPEWADIAVRADRLPANKRWRFAPDAMERFDRENRGFLDRHLQDTQYLSRIAREYLTRVCHPDRVWVIPGRLTALLRGVWGLNSLLSDHNLKTRVDHRHHAIDAAVVGVTDKALLQRIATNAARLEDKFDDRLLEGVPVPWEGFRDDLGAALGRIVVSHRADHGAGGRLHEDTAYGLVRDPEAEGGHNLVHRKPLADLNDNEVERIRDPDLRAALSEYLAAATRDGEDRKAALKSFAERNADRWPGLRRVRLLKKDDPVVPIRDRAGKVYKAVVPGENFALDIWSLPGGGWTGTAITVFDANQKGASGPERPHPAARRVMRVFKGDLMALDMADGPEVFRAVRLEPSANRIRLVGQYESGNLTQRHADPDDPFRWVFASYAKLREWRARKVTVSPDGVLNDPGFRP